MKVRNTLMAGVALASVVVPVSAHSYAKDAQSTNWAGYIAAPQYSAIGSWYVEPVATASEVDEWVGIGGYNTNTILQAGVQYDSDGSAWLWTEDYPAPPKHYVPVMTGDQIGVQVTAHKIVVHDYTQHYRKAYHFPHFNATGADVEAVMEVHDAASRTPVPFMATNVPDTLRMDNTRNMLYPTVATYPNGDNIVTF